MDVFRVVTGGLLLFRCFVFVAGGRDVLVVWEFVSMGP